MFPLCWQIVYRNGWYYLFFAAGKYCTSSYSEGVARSKGNIFGPYQKLLVPVLSTGMLGNSHNGQQLVGPGHGTFVTDPANPAQLVVVFHASPGDNCNRFSYAHVVTHAPRLFYLCFLTSVFLLRANVSSYKVVFGSDGWPYIDFQQNASSILSWPHGV